MIKYLGSKRRLVPALGELCERSGARTALDLFTGTTRVAQEFKRRGARVWAVDSARYSEALARCYVAMDASAVDEAALAAALATGRLRGAALDVFEHEPLAPDSPLWSREDVLITPHVSGFHADYWNNVVDIFAGNLRRLAAGAPLANSVDKEAGY